MKTHEAMMYRSGSKWRIFAAFVTALMIQSAAIAIAPLRHALPPERLEEAIIAFLDPIVEPTTELETAISQQPLAEPASP